MTSKLIVKLGVKLAIAYTIITSLFTIAAEVTNFIIEGVLKRNIYNASALRVVIIPQTIIVLVGITIYLYLENSTKKEAQKASIIDSILLSQYKPIFNAFLGILVIVNALTIIITTTNSTIYYLSYGNITSHISNSFSISIFRGYIIRLVFNIIKILVGIALLVGFKINKKTPKIDG